MKTRILPLLFFALLLGCDGGDEVGQVVRPNSPSAPSTRPAKPEDGTSPKPAAATAQPSTEKPLPSADEQPQGPPGPADSSPPASLPDAPSIAPPTATELPPAPRVPTNYPGQDPKPYVAVQVSEGGEPFVMVNFPWQNSPRPSVQIVLAADDAALAAQQPVALEGATLESLWNDQLRELGLPAVRSSARLFEYGQGQLLTIQGEYNALNKPCGYGIDLARGDLLVFYRPDTWAQDNGLFCVGLQDLKDAAAYQHPGRLRVWVLDQEKVVHTDTVDWPGAAASPTVPETTTPLTEPDVSAEPGTPPAAPAPETSSSPAEPTQPVLPQATDVQGTPAGPLTEPEIPSPPEQPGALGPAMVVPSPESPPADAASPPAQAVQPPASTAPAVPAPVEAAQPPVVETPAVPAEAAPPPAAQAPAAAVEPASPKEVDWRNGSVEQLAGLVEKFWGTQMTPEARAAWKLGWTYYQKSPNPSDVRLFVFRRQVKAAFDSESNEEVRNGLNLFYERLRAE